MKDLLIPLGLVVFILLFTFAIIHTARKQRKAKVRVFRDFTDRHALSYRGEDDGRAQAFAEGFDGIGRFSSPSLGKVIPQDVVRGSMDGVKGGPGNGSLPALDVPNPSRKRVPSSSMRERPTRHQIILPTRSSRKRRLAHSIWWLGPHRRPTPENSSTTAP